MKTRVAHSLPGRLRLTAEGLRYLKEESPAIAAELASIPGVRLARVTVCTGGILLQYDRGMVESAELSEQADLVLARSSAWRPCASSTHESGARKRPRKQPMTTSSVWRKPAGRERRGAGAGQHPADRSRLMGGALANFTSLEALASLGLSAPMAKSAWEGLAPGSARPTRIS